MRYLYFKRLISTWVLSGLALCGATNAVAQEKKLATNSTSSSSLIGNGTISLSSPHSTICINSPETFTSRGTGCSSWSWTVDGNDATGTAVSNGSNLTFSWSTPGTYTVQATADCSPYNSAATASKTITVVGPPATPEPITFNSSGRVTQVTPSSVLTCAGNFLDLTPPTGSSNWAWNGDPLPRNSSGAVVMNNYGTVQVAPTAASTTYTLTYTSASSPCPRTSSFTVNVASGNYNAYVVQNTERFGHGVLNLSVQEPGQNFTYAWYDNANSSTPLPNGNTAAFTTPDLSLSRSYYLGVTDCGPESRQEVRLLVKQIRIKVGGNVPTAPVALAYSADGVAPPSVLLQAETEPNSNGPFVWERNGAPVMGQTGSQLFVTQAGSYVVHLPTTGPEYDSQTVEVVEPFDGQTANGQPLTYMSVVKVLKPNVMTAAEVKQLAGTDRQQTLVYANGFGQPIQEVSMQAGADLQDIVKHLDFTSSPTTTRTYLLLPETAQTKAPGLYETDLPTKLDAYYASKGGLPYETTTLESSPLSRPLEQSQTGLAWAGHANRISYQANAAQEVRRWVGLDGTQWYAEGQLRKEIQLDPDNRQTEVFKDLMGRVVLQRKVSGTGATRETFDTYNVYAESGYLQAVIPPMAVRELASLSQWNIAALPASSPSFQSRWLYQYTYDDRGRLVERHFPGAGPVYLVYDPFNRPILIQDGNHRTAGKWLFTKVRRPKPTSGGRSLFPEYRAPNATGPSRRSDTSR